MPFETADRDRRLRDIRDNILLAYEFIGEQTPEAFARDKRTHYAVVRCLEIISEASRRLPTELKAAHPDIPWAKIAGAGNVYRPNYEDVFVEVICNTVQSLDRLLECTQSELSSRDEPA